MSKDDKKRNIKVDISKDILRNKDMAVRCSDLPRKKCSSLSKGVNKTILPSDKGETGGSSKRGKNTKPQPRHPELVSGSHSERTGGRFRNEFGMTQTKKPSIMQKALKAAAMFALALGTSAMSADSQAQAAGNAASIRGGGDVEAHVLQEQDKHRRFLSYKSGTKFTNRIIRTNTLRVNPEVLNALQNSIGQREGVMRDLALRASEATLTQGSHAEHDNVTLNLNSHAELVSASPIVANDVRFRNKFGMTDAPKADDYTVGINSIETIEVESSMSLRGVDEVNDAAIHNTYDNQTQTAGLLHFVRNDMKTGFADTVIASEILPPVEGKWAIAQRGSITLNPLPRLCRYCPLQAWGRGYGGTEGRSRALPHP